MSKARFYTPSYVRRSRYEAKGQAYEIQLAIDEEDLLTQMARRAVYAKTRKSQILGGAVRAKVRAVL